MANAYITEAFKRLSMLDEDVFDVTDDGIQELKDFEDDNDVEDIVDVIDPEAEDEEELEDTYVGKVILDCCVCHSKIYKNKDEVHLSEDETIANEDEECPYCYSTDGFKVIGEVAEFSKEEEKEDEVKDDDEEEVEVKDEEEEVVEESVKKTRKAKSLKEGLKKRNLKESWGDVFEDLVDRAKSWIDDGDDIDEAIAHALDDGLIYTSDIVDLGIHYGAINDGEVIEAMYEDLYGDIYAQVEDYYEEVRAEDDGNFEDTDESLRKKSCKGRKRVNESKLPKRVVYTASDLALDTDDYFEDDDVLGDIVGDMLSDDYGYCHYGFNMDKKYNENGEPSEVVVTNIEWDTSESLRKKSCKGRKCKEAVSKRDDIDAEADDKKERAKKAFARAKDDADADRDYRLKKGITRKNEACKGKKVKEDYDTQFKYNGDTFYVNDLNTIIKNAKSVAKRDGYNQIVYQEDDGSYTISRDYPGNNITGKIVARIKIDGRNNVSVLKEVNEDFNEVTITTDDTHMEMTSDENGKVTVTTEPTHNDEDVEAVIAPIDDETKVEIENNDIEEPEDGEEEIEAEVDEFSEDEFDELGESFLKKAYNNVDSFKTTGAVVKGNSLKVEGLITFKSGAKKKTNFVFESKDMSKRGKYRLIGENLQLSRGHKSFTVIGTINNKKFVSESLNYNYRASDANGKSQRVYGTVRVSKK